MISEIMSEMQEGRMSEENSECGKFKQTLLV